MSRRMVLFAGLGAIPLLIIGGSFYYANMRYGTEPKACTDDLRTCPDGSSVSRMGSQCAFAECPSVEVEGGNTSQSTTEGAPLSEGDVKTAPPKPSTTTSSPPKTSLPFTGLVLAGSLDTSPLLAYTASDYALARASDLLIVFHFHTNFSPMSRAEGDAMASAFSKLPPGAVGFRINYLDGATSADERSLARTLSVTETDVKYILKDGMIIASSSEPWTAYDFTVEIEARM